MFLWRLCLKRLPLSTSSWEGHRTNTFYFTAFDYVILIVHILRNRIHISTKKINKSFITSSVNTLSHLVKTDVCWIVQHLWGLLDAHVACAVLCRFENSDSKWQDLLFSSCYWINSMIQLKCILYFKCNVLSPIYIWT